MVSIRLLSLVSVFGIVLASPTYRDFIVHERRDVAPKGFVHNGPAAATEMLNLRIALKSNDLPGLEKALMDVSTPSSALWRQFLTKEEVCTIYYSSFGDVN